jgi:rhodanese-related sulfurtransferase
MFVAAEASERYFGGRESAGSGAPPSPAAPARARRAAWLPRTGAGLLVALAVLTALLGQPSATQRWRWIAGQSERDLATRSVFIDPAEVVDLRRDLNLSVRVFEVRPEADYNRFHLAGSVRIDPTAAEDRGFLRAILGAPDTEIRFLASNDEAAAVEAWKELKAQGAINLYILAGGINGWLRAFPPHPEIARPRDGQAGPDGFDWDFRYSLGEKIPSAHPEVARRDPWPAELAAAAGPASAVSATWFDGRRAPPAPETRKVLLQRKVVAKGGCG